ncbi:hypothetical protein BH09MYX1_BH09MYX1_56680 [soil metagenome]
MLDEHVNDDGTLAHTWLRAEAAGLLVVEPDRSRPLPEGAIEATFARFGGELADDVVVTEDGLRVSDGSTIHRLRHLARYDVIARDYLVLKQVGALARVAIAVTIAAALRHLAHAHERCNTP